MLAITRWVRILLTESVGVGLRSYVGAVVPIAVPAMIAGTVALVATRLVLG